MLRSFYPAGAVLERRSQDSVLGSVSLKQGVSNPSGMKAPFVGVVYQILTSQLKTVAKLQLGIAVTAILWLEITQHEEG